MSEILEKWRATAGPFGGDVHELSAYFGEIMDAPEILNPACGLSDNSTQALLHDLGHYTQLLSCYEAQMAPGLPSFGPHWRYITRIKAIAELVGASHVAAACEQTYARLSAVPEHHIDAVVHHHNIEAVEQAEDIGLLLDGLVTDAPLAIGLDAEASGETPDTRTTHYANVNALIERVRRGENIPAGPLDPELRCWMEAHVKAAAHKQNTLDHYIGMGHTVAHRFVVMQGTERTVDAFMLDALSAQNAYVVAMDFISLPAMSPTPLTGQMLTAADGRSFALLHFKDVDCLLDLNSRQQIACRRAINPQPAHVWTVAQAPRLTVDIAKRQLRKAGWNPFSKAGLNISSRIAEGS
jgi:hypothetical protein